VAGQSRYIDPVTGDYVMENGNFKRATGAGSSVHIAVKMQRGSCPLAPKLGSRFHELRKMTPNVVKLTEAFAKECLKHLVERKDITLNKVAAKVVTPTAMSLLVQYTDKSGTPNALTTTTKVG
jgi:phage gp46-like protein